MSYKFQTVEALKARMRQQQNQSSARSAFNDGLSSSKIWQSVQSFPVDSLEEDSYEIEQREDEILAAKPDNVSCGGDIPVVSGNFTGDPVYYNPFKKRVALEMCKSRCGPKNFVQKHDQAEKEAGASHGKLLESVFWMGDGVKPGITRTVGTEFSGLSGTNYKDLNTKDAVQIANLFSMLTWGMIDPVIYHGPITAELIGWRSQSSTGDNCGDVWKCMVNQLASRFGESEGALRSRFKSVAQFDHTTGLDPNNPADANAALMIIDRGKVKMGISGVELGSVWSDGADLAFSERIMGMTTPQNRKYGATRFAHGFLDHGEVLDAEGGRYADYGMPKITVPTPLL